MFDAIIIKKVEVKSHRDTSPQSSIHVHALVSSLCLYGIVKIGGPWARFIEEGWTCIKTRGPIVLYSLNY